MRDYAQVAPQLANSASETLWCSPHCAAEVPATCDLFAEVSDRAPEQQEIAA